MPDTLNQIEVTTRRYIDTNPKIADLVFNTDPLMSMLEKDCLVRYSAGSTYNANFIYDVQDGGAYSKGQDMPADQRQVEQQLRFDLKYQTVMLPFYKEDIKVLNVAGNMEAVVDLVTERVDGAYMQLGAQTAIQMYLQGQTGNYVKNLNGLQEALSNGTSTGLTADTFATYGTLTRTTYGGRMLSPAPLDFGGQAITLPSLDAMYQSVNYGSGEYEPNVIMTTVKGFGYIRNNFQTQQRFQNVETANGGFRGLQYNGAIILAGRYVPGSYLTANAGTNDIVAKRFFQWTTGGALSRYPDLTGLSTGESIWMLNVRKPNIRYIMSAHNPFNGNLDDDGFIPSAGNTKIVGKILLAHNLAVLPGYHCYGFNFQS